MGNTYYYLVASLSLLEFGMKPPISYEAFLEDCRRVLPQSDYEIVKDATFDPEAVTHTRNSVLGQCNRFRNDCCNEMARFRAIKAGKDPSKYLRGEASPNPFLADAFVQASKSPDPLTAEKLLDRMKWEYLDELGLGHFFDLEFLIVYGLKLQILKRHKEIASSKGEETLENFRQSAMALGESIK